MKAINKIKLMGAASCLLMSSITTSCNFLEIVPPEQATIEDATMNADRTLGFLYSCYSSIWCPIRYQCAEASVDEFVMPELWENYSNKIAYDLYTPEVYVDWRWEQAYKGISQVHLFLEQLENAQGCEEEDIEEWKAEAYFLLAYYHFEILRFHGPAPIMDKYMDRNATVDEFPGRSHYDYVTDWIVKLLDEKVIGSTYLPMDRPSEEKGRATKLIAYALKGRVLLYAASPLWNGSFPFPDWKNKVETPGYGYELVSKEYKSEKWQRALEANLEALEKAQSIGIDLYNDMEHYKDQNIKLEDVYIPGIENLSKEEQDKFKEKVLMLRYMITAQYNEGNTELIWGYNTTEDGTHEASMPNRVYQDRNGNWYSGWSGVSPTLFTVEHFYTMNGKLPSQDSNFPSEGDWLKRSGVSQERPDIINLNVGREPRFYAWLAFDQGDYGVNIANGEPLILQLKDGEKQGYNPSLFNRNHCVTGYLSQKWVRPNQIYTETGWNVSTVNKFHRPLIRVSELYLNIAECYAALGDDANAIKYTDFVRDRAGVPKLADIGTDGMSVMDWVRNERFIEFWGEGQRYFDLRRWVIAVDYLSAGKREGLNANTKVSPTFDEFNTRVVIDQPFRWSDRLYLAPIDYSEMIKNPNLVQAPGYN